MGPVAEIILIGGGGHCRSVISVLEEIKEFKIIGILDIPEMVGQLVLGYPVIGTDHDIPRLAEGKSFHVALGHIKSNTLRRNAFNLVTKSGGKLPALISPRAMVSAHATVGLGTVVMHGAILNAGANVGLNCIINSGAIVEHDVTVKDHSHVGPGACINGGCTIGTNVFVGSNAVIVQGLNIADGSLVAAGAVVTANVQDAALIAGNPGAVKRKL